MITVKVFLKNGNVVEFEAEDVEKETSGGELVGFNWSHGESKRRLFYIRLDDVSAILAEDS